MTPHMADRGFGSIAVPHRHKYPHRLSFTPDKLPLYWSDGADRTWFSLLFVVCGMCCRSLLAASLRWFGASSDRACHLGSAYWGHWDFWGFSRSPSKWDKETVYTINNALHYILCACFYRALLKKNRLWFLSDTGPLSGTWLCPSWAPWSPLSACFFSSFSSSWCLPCWGCSFLEEGE